MIPRLQCLTLMGMLASPCLTWAAPAADQFTFFETSIRPLLAEHCVSCHGPTKHENGLRLDVQAAVTRGSDYGLVIKPGDPAGSKLMQAVRHQPGVEAMPKKGAQLTGGQIALLDQWIRSGAPWPQDRVATERPAWQSHWAFQKVTRPPLPKGALPGYGNAIDAFVSVKLKAAGLDFAPAADAATLCRRIHLTLTGLLPDYQDVQAFCAAHARNHQSAVSSLVEQLLSSPSYGERWARAWLDVARYSDTEGYQVAGKDIRYPYAYTYRDWVVRALNDDMPYDRFVMQQLAADRMAPANESSSDLAALGFLTINDTFIGNRDLQTDDRIDATARGLLGLTVGCARCHDHKYDPISMRDYYGLYSIFNSSEIPDQLPVIGHAPSEAAYASYRGEVQKIEDQKAAYRRELYEDMRKPERLTAYLAFVHEASVKGLKDEAYRGRAGQLQLRDRVAKRWQTLVQQTAGASNPSPVMAAWAAFEKLPDDQFATKAAAVIQSLTTPGAKCAPEVAHLFASKPAPKSFADVAAGYAELFLKHLQPLNATDGIHALLMRPASPMSASVDEMEDFFTRKDREHVVRMDNQLKRIELTNAGAPPRAMVMRDKEKPADVHVFIRGNPARPGPLAPRANLSLLGGQAFQSGSGRLELARAIASRDNPLTSRVIVNRIWAQHFGKPLVPNPSDFGVQTAKPEQADLLDYLAASFMDAGWSLKSLHRLILTSMTYRQSCETTPDKLIRDAENNLLSRFNRQRLDYESMRDAIVQAAGRLDKAALGGRSVPLNDPTIDSRRTLYHFVDRYEQATVPATFDFANPDSHSPMRFVTTVPQQALFLMNSPFMQRQAAALSASLPVNGSSVDAETITALYRRVLLREPTTRELELAGRFVADAGTLIDQSACRWTYGTERLARTSAGGYELSDWTPFTVFKEMQRRPTWSHTGVIPDPKWHYAFLHAGGGHAPAGDLVISRVWSAPFDATIRIGGEVSRDSDRGNGVRALILRKDGSLIAEALASPKQRRVTLKADSVRVRAGETLHFAISAENGETDSDSFEWAPVISRLSPDGMIEVLTDARTDFCGPDRWPLNRPKPQPALQQLAQTLLMSNEFMFVD